MRGKEALMLKMKYLIQDLFVEQVPTNLLLGSSSAMRLNTDFLNCQPWLNRGIGNSLIKNISNYIELTPLKIQPNAIVIYAGENDISSGITTENVADEYHNLLLELMKKFPRSQTIILPIKPSPAREEFWADFKHVNLQIAAISEEHVQIHFYDKLWDSLSPMNETHFLPDGLHLNEDAYKHVISSINLKCQHM